MTEKEIRENVRIMIASLNDKYPKTPLLKWQDLEDGIVWLMKSVLCETDTV